MTGVRRPLHARAGITYRQLDHWCRQGYVPGRGATSEGRGVVRHFTAQAERRVMTLARLVRAGLPVARAADLAEPLERDGQVELGDGLVLWDVPPDAPS